MSKSYRHDGYDRFERKRRAESRNARRSSNGWFNQSNRKNRSEQRQGMLDVELNTLVANHF